MPSFVAIVKKINAWVPVLDTNGNVRRSSSASDFVNELKTSYPLTGFIIAEELTVNATTGAITGGSLDSDYESKQNMKAELPYEGA